MVGASPAISALQSSRVAVNLTPHLLLIGLSAGAGKHGRRQRVCERIRASAGIWLGGTRADAEASVSWLLRPTRICHAAAAAVPSCGASSRSCRRHSHQAATTRSRALCTCCRATSYRGRISGKAAHIQHDVACVNRTDCQGMQGLSRISTETGCRIRAGVSPGSRLALRRPPQTPLRWHARSRGPAAPAAGVWEWAGCRRRCRRCLARRLASGQQGGCVAAVRCRAAAAGRS